MTDGWTAPDTVPWRTPMRRPSNPSSLVAVVLSLAACLWTPRLAAAETGLVLNDREYFASRGLDVMVFSSEYNGMFFDEKTSGIELIHHGVRTATGGAVRVNPAPEQWD